MLVLMGLMNNGVLAYNAYIQLLVLPPALLSIFRICVLSRSAWGGQQQHKQPLWSFFKLQSSARSYAVYADASGTVGSCMSSIDPCKLDCSLSLMKSPALNAAFAMYVEKALCYESYKFLVDATAYADGVYTTPAEQVRSTLYLLTIYSITAHLRLSLTI
jgi:hypothetical protein